MTKTPAQLNAEIAEALSGPAWLISRKKDRVDPTRFRDLIKKAVKFPEFTAPSKYTWDLIHGVPIHELDPGSKIDYESNPESDEEEADENLARYHRIATLLGRQGKKPWPIVVGQDGEVLDGHHRLAVLSDHGAAKVDVLWVRPIQPKGKRRC